MPFRIAVPLWKTAPFIRLLFPVALGILLQWYLSFSLVYLLTCWLGFLFSFIVFQFLPLRLRYRLGWYNGATLNMLIGFTGMLLTWCKDIRHQSDWLGNVYCDSSYVIVRLAEPPVAKPKSNKVEVIAESVIQGGNLQRVTGRLILYIEKDSLHPLHYGDRLMLYKPLQPIRSMGNPGGFDYAQYAAFQQVFHTVWLKQGDYMRLEQGGGNAFQRWLLRCKDNILDILRKNISGKDERAIAEALLIGYKEDLDKDLVQAYSNTGVVHIIAISGLHLGLVYWLLTRLVGWLPLVKRSRVIKLLILLAGLWLFTLLTGASASVLRSAVMFTCIIAGENLGRKTSIYNSLAASAVLLLVYNPFFLWDVGFQLSYLAVLGIVLFHQRICGLLYIKYRWLRYGWEMIAISLSAQVLTFPVCLYYFHQFPILFLLANIIAVPLSSIVLFAEIALIAVSWWPWLSTMLGKGVDLSLLLLNRFIAWLNTLPFAVWEGVTATVTTTLLLYGIIGCTAAWLGYKRPALLLAGMAVCLAFVLIHDEYRWNSFRQQKLVVYNVPRSRAIDFAVGNDYCFMGDSSLEQKGLLQNTHLNPARVALQFRHKVDWPAVIKQQRPFIAFGSKRVVLVDTGFIALPLQARVKVDIVIVSGNPRLRIADLQQVLDCSMYVFDASNSLWKISQWKKECDQLLLRCHSVAGEGAFIADVSP